MIFKNGVLKFSESLDKCNAKQAPNKSIVLAVLILTANVFIFWLKYNLVRYILVIWMVIWKYIILVN